MIFKVSSLAAFCLLFAQPLAAQPTGDALTPQQFFDVGVTMMRAGRPQDAANVADALLARAPNDPSALILRAEAAINLRDYASAVEFARAAYRATENKNQKFAAARLVALAHSQSENDTLAQLWLRRARQYAPDATAARSIAEDYQFLRDRNPWSMQLRFGATPSSNINNGSAKSSSFLYGLPFELQLGGSARALSGIEISGGFDTRYRLSQSNNAITFLTASADARSYVLSQTAQDYLQDEYDEAVVQCAVKSDPAACIANISPIETGSDFADSSIGFGLHHRRILTEGGRPTDFHLDFNQMWYSGDAYSRSLRAQVSHSWQIAESDYLLGLVSAERITFAEDRDEINGTRILARWTHQFENNNSFSFGVDVNKRQSVDDSSAYDAVTYSADYNIAKPLYGMRFGFGVNYEERDYAYFGLAAGARNDRAIGADLSVELTEVEFYGFRPVARLSARRNESSLNLFDRDYTNLGFDLRSSF